MKKKIKSNIFYFVILFYTVIFFKFFENIYVILLNNYENRLKTTYGICNKEAYGYVNKNITEKILEDNFIIINKDKNFPSIRGLFYTFSNRKTEKKYVFLLNEIDEFSIKKNFIDYQIINKEDNCYLLKKND